MNNGDFHNHFDLDSQLGPLVLMEEVDERLETAFWCCDSDGGERSSCGLEF